MYLKGVGPKVSALFEKADIRTLWDLLLALPRTYEDRRRFHTPQEMQVAALRQDSVLGRATIEKYAWKQGGPGGKRWLEAIAVLENSEGATSLLGDRVLFTWFNLPGGGSLPERFPEGSTVVFRGKAQIFRERLQIAHPDFQKSDQELPFWEFGGFVPVYREVSGLSTRLLRKIMAQALERPEFLDLPEALPASTLARLKLPPFRESLRELHFPKTWVPNEFDPRPEGPPLQRVAFEELFMMALALHLRRSEWKKAQSSQAERIPRIITRVNFVASETKHLPFTLTGDQARALDEILGDLALADGPATMHRLVQGDVGSGKTIVAFLAAIAAMDAGYQAVLMAPTEILADQHFQNFAKFFPERSHETLLLKGALTQKKKSETREALAKGTARFAIGTQALLTDTTLFEKLGLVIIDEQHRFGVEQRAGLKHQSGGVIPHLLVMTATPIPRSLALTYYGDLSTSLIREKPPGRTPIQTHVIKRKAVPKLAERLRRFLNEGRQIYIVYPLVEESEELDLKDVQRAFQEWTRDLDGFRIGLLHGRLKPAEKDAAMRAFKSGEYRVLVSTTVIEVGVDVPNASVIVIEHAERFGLSQLHQLRGRVGRGATESYCVLVGPDNPGPDVRQRLSLLETNDDGFEIAEADLRMRGPGEFLGRRQSGLLGFRVADLMRDADLMVSARNEARRILEEDPQLMRPENSELKRLLDKWWKGRLELTLSG